LGHAPIYAGLHTRWLGSRYQKSKINVQLTEAEESECQHPITQFFTGRMPFLPPNQLRQSTEGTAQTAHSPEMIKFTLSPDGPV